jgi:hypothetical protein
MSPTNEAYRAERKMTKQLQTLSVRLKYDNQYNLNSEIMYTILSQNTYIEIFHPVVGIKYAA